MPVAPPVTSATPPATTPVTSSAAPRPTALDRVRTALPASLLWPTVVTALNALLFVVLRPDVNDLWAARARAAATSDGVGLTYWFGWFGGGTTPGTYSIITPPLSALVGTELLCGLAAVAVTALGTAALRGTRHRVPAAWVLMLACTANLWSGRVPFLVGTALGLGALLAVRARRPVLVVVLTTVGILASPTTGAFLALGLWGTFVTTRTRQWRPITAWAIGTSVVALLAVAVLFGSPGPEPFSLPVALEGLGLLVLLWLTAPPADVRTTIQWSAPLVVALWAVPNGMGSNIMRFVWFVLPVVVVATTGRRLRVALLLVAPAVIAGLTGTVSDLRNAVRPVSSVDYYEPLAQQLDRLPDLDQYRLEVVNHGAHAGYDALLDHAMLARGWETQEDIARNLSLRQDPLSPITYKLWLDNNAVGYVALPSTSVNSYPEYALVRSGRARYLRAIWHSADWTLFRVADRTPIAAAPARAVRHSQSSLTVDVPCACTVHLRIRWSKFLGATLQQPKPAPGQEPPDPVTARVADDGEQWTELTTPRAGRYVLSGSFTGLLR